MKKHLDKKRIGLVAWLLILTPSFITCIYFTFYYAINPESPREVWVLIAALICILSAILLVGHGLLIVVIFSLPILFCTLGVYYLGYWVVVNYISWQLNWLLDWTVGAIILITLFAIWKILEFLFHVIRWLVSSIPDVINYIYHNGEDKK